MANYWVITIGINQYRHLQPLMHAQNDALFTHRFFTEEVGIPAPHCVLLSDLATSVAQQVVYPDKPAIAAWLQTITQQVEADDVLWFFFSGYGAQTHTADGQNVDYLMPIDGDPGQVEKTGIAVAELIDTLAELPTNKTLLVLDINRSQGAMAGQAIGTQIIDLAQKRQVSTLLSCQPEQYSHETLGVRHGLFTAALLEALQQNCKTPSQISSYLNQRLPELCEHHWRPIQNPVSILAAQAETEVVPTLTRELPVDVPVDVPVDADRPVDIVEPPFIITPPFIAPPNPEEALSANAYDDPDAYDDPANLDPTSGAAGGLAEEPIANRSLENRSIENRSREDESSDVDAAISGAKLRNWGLFALVLLMGGVLLKQPFVKAAWDGLSEKIETATAGNQSPAPNQPSTAEGASTGETAGVPVAGAQGESGKGDLSPSPQANGTDSKVQAPAVLAKPSKDEDDEKNGATTAEEKTAAQSLISKANAALAQKQYSEALITLQQVPKSQRDEKFSSVLTQARAGAAAAQQANASVLTEARTAIQPTQASQFTEAIAKARLIKPGEPYYEAAQEDIRSWSQVILDIAEGRATSGSLESAIAAAKVMPFDNAEYHQKAQDRIIFWQQRQQSRTVIAEAQKIPKLGEASTYQEGIVKLREVPIEHPEYEAAQRLADQWSESIFSIAQARAAQGRERAAIQAAVLVPAGTIAYEPTQQAIKRWRASSGE